METAKIIHPSDLCGMCHTPEFWRMKGTRNRWVCRSCHPPTPGPEEIEVYVVKGIKWPGITRIKRWGG